MDTICFVAGLFIGVAVGMLVMACCVMAKRGDREEG